LALVDLATLLAPKAYIDKGALSIRGRMIYDHGNSLSSLRGAMSGASNPPYPTPAVHRWLYAAVNAKGHWAQFYGRYEILIEWPIITVTTGNLAAEALNSYDMSDADWRDRAFVEIPKVYAKSGGHEGISLYHMSGRLRKPIAFDQVAFRSPLVPMPDDFHKTRVYHMNGDSIDRIRVEP
jgi:hypothetical protein